MKHNADYDRIMKMVMAMGKKPPLKKKEDQGKEADEAMSGEDMDSNMPMEDEESETMADEMSESPEEQAKEEEEDTEMHDVGRMKNKRHGLFSKIPQVLIALKVHKK